MAVSVRSDIFRECDGTTLTELTLRPSSTSLFICSELIQGVGDGYVGLFLLQVLESGLSLSDLAHADASLSSAELGSAGEEDVSTEADVWHNESSSYLSLFLRAASARGRMSEQPLNEHLGEDGSLTRQF